MTIVSQFVPADNGPAVLSGMAVTSPTMPVSALDAVKLADPAGVIWEVKIADDGTLTQTKV
jgi:hypothetical protein